MSHKLLSKGLLKPNLVEQAFMLAAQMWPHKALLHIDVGQIRDLSAFSYGGFRVGKKKNQREARAVQGLCEQYP